MDKRKYANHADAVFTVFEMLRRELAAECDDSAMLGRLREIASLPAAGFFAALGDLAAGLPTQADPSDVLSRCAPLPGALAKPLTIPRHTLTERPRINTEVTVLC
ncbi:hypothetical protein WQE_09594 [Paraburkholderia hospita]|uniref:Uncharacterized protein n=1 Tax=Paraburkholderia hospita TaxID=169430 RepID=A0ABN0FR99_9BURK|nr:hypothetical protein [Paraburkholderia hospita]EIN01324.1 hypothetical protein WQE_09594 [Paraburkholderia hospita]OUL87553.1 hypothetical protein CA602_13650 [Paraburkholderia hospita]